jgi:hypothetical protein
MILQNFSIPGLATNQDSVQPPHSLVQIPILFILRSVLIVTPPVMSALQTPMIHALLAYLLLNFTHLNVFLPAHRDTLIIRI